MNTFDRSLHYLNDNARPRARIQTGCFVLVAISLAMWAGLIYGVVEMIAN